MSTTSLVHLFNVDSEDDWRANSACKGMDPDIFFSSDLFENKQEKDDRETVAKGACMACNVRDDCLEYSIKAGERYGIWGGLTEQERRSLVRRRTAELRAGRRP